MNPRTVLSGLTLVGALATVGCNPQQQAEVNATAKVAGQEAQVVLKKGEKAAKDTAVTSRVKTALMASGQLDASGIGVSTDKNKIYLTGHVPNAKQKQLAHQIVDHTMDPGSQIVDQIQIHQAAPAKKH